MEYLSPVEICKLARLNQAFRAASWADCVWESKLPLNYRFLVRRVIGDFAPIMSKREIYTRLCQQNPLDGGNKVKFHLIVSSLMPDSMIFYKVRANCSLILFWVFDFLYFVFRFRNFGWINTPAVFVYRFLQWI